MSDEVAADHAAAAAFPARDGRPVMSDEVADHAAAAAFLYAMAGP